MAAVADFPSLASRRQGIQPHIPRLSYRNGPSTTSISDCSISTIRSNSSAASISTCATSPPTSSFSGSPRWIHSSDPPLSPLCLDGASDTPSASTFLSPQSAQAPKKKSSSFFGFLSVKEPSTQAFEAYQEQMKKRGTTQNGRANAVGLPGVSSAKLPPTVPKVNSKWDGVSAPAQERAKKDQDLDRPSFCYSATRPVYTSRSTGSNMTGMTKSSTSSSSSKSSTASAPRVNGKLKFDHDNQNLSAIYGWETLPPSNGSSTGSLPLESRGSASPTPTLCRDYPSFLSSPPPTIVKAPYETFPDHPPPLEFSSNRSSPSLLPAPSSPATPNGSSHALPLSPRIDELNKKYFAKGSLTASNNDVGFASSGTNVLGPPVTATYKLESERSRVLGANKGAASSSNSMQESSSTEPSSILKRPTLSSNEIWPVVPPPADLHNGERSIATPRTANGTKSRFLSIFSKGA